MTADKRTLADDLLDLDPRTPAGGDEFERRADQLFNRRLTPVGWIHVAIMGVGGAIGATVCGLLAATEPAGTTTLTRVVLAGLAGIGLFWVAPAGAMARRGAVSNFHRAAAAKMGFVFSLLAAVLIGVASLAGLGAGAEAGLVLLPVATLVLATVVVLGHEVRQAELRVQQRLLEVEYRIVRLAENALLQNAHERE